MKRILTCMVLILMVLAPVFGEVVKKTKAEVTFKGFGTFKSEQTEKIAAEKKLTDSKNEFKGKGIAGKLAGTFALKSGESAELIDLTTGTLSSLDHKKKEYSTRPIVPLGSSGETPANAQKKDETEDEETESPVRIIRSEFKVEKSGETASFNQFPSLKYLVTWITEWENTSTGQKGTDRLVTDVWTTSLSGDLADAREEEAQFSQRYMSLLGIDAVSLQQAVLGTNWLQALSGLSGDSPKTQSGYEDLRIAEELQKIEGYPVVIDGRYFAVREGGEQAEANEESSGVRGALGRFAKKTITGGDKKDADEPALAFKTEILELRTGSIGSSEFEIPANYKEKK